MRLVCYTYNLTCIKILFINRNKIKVRNEVVDDGFHSGHCIFGGETVDVLNTIIAATRKYAEYVIEIFHSYIFS